RISTTSVSPGSAPSIAIGPTSPGHWPPAFSYHSPHKLSLSRTSPGCSVSTGGLTANVGWRTVGLKWCVSELATEAASVRPQSARNMETSGRWKIGILPPGHWPARERSGLPFVTHSCQHCSLPCPAPWMEDALMNKETRVDTTFGSIEGAADYLGLLIDSVNDAREALEAAAALAAAARAAERSRPASRARARPTTTSVINPAPAPARVFRKGTRSSTTTANTTVPASSAHHAHASPRRYGPSVMARNSAAKPPA